MKFKSIISLFMFTVALGIAASAQDVQPQSKSHAHVLGHVAKYTYKAGKDVVKGTGKAVAFTAEEIF
jgi:hypothetical protein